MYASLTYYIKLRSFNLFHTGWFTSMYLYVQYITHIKQQLVAIIVCLLFLFNVILQYKSVISATYYKAPK